MSTLTFTAIGGGDEIGANSYRISTADCDILLDCGVHPKKDGFEALPDFSLLDRPPAAAIISHGHIDHCGSLPALLRKHPATIPYSTRPTQSIMDRMLHNSVSVMTTLAEERGIKGYPLYTHDEADYAVRRTRPVALGREFHVVADGVTAELHHAGHVLGGASIVLRTPGHTILYTGDICAADQELISGFSPVPPGPIDTLIVECTYGANPAADNIELPDEVERFADACATVIERGGAVLVPAFALGRTQEILNVIARLQETGRLPEVPVYTSGLGRAIYELYDQYSIYLRDEAVLAPLSSFQRVGDVWDPLIARDLLRRPCIIVATSGMMIENTPSAVIAQHVVREQRHGIFFVGYLDPDTLGYKLLHAEPGDVLTFELGGPGAEIALDDIQRFYFSAHAPRKELLALVERVRPKNVVFVHGDPEAIHWMYHHCDGDYNRYMTTRGAPITLEA